ncbi:type II toxin-antitoxin system VapC family toxin [Phreatobacter oligotrophus]|jgi:ribonuclease VapC|uniref:Ribonuclease VapC n=1 Tax=Phreatobacter oligotrophus TaxID=1122261 RepID=A0A2T4Z387_9HYPH|nr:type II toxin-antitoxin system VapC family toxin [Phreatobacter oligotrophus]PTM55235.1 ribonuclease VapC [Phreatobacter oligotrophus]
MIVCDTSALIAILKVEPESLAFRRAIAEARPIAMPASVYLEAAMVAYGLKLGREELDAIIAASTIAFIPLDEPIARIAADAFARYGRGTGHPAALNFGDCISYATAKHLDCPLLFKGDDFRHTDVKAAL